MKENDGGPAFPFSFFATAYSVDKTTLTVPDIRDHPQGMSLRDWFAGMALEGRADIDECAETTAGICYFLADAMLDRREAIRQAEEVGE